MVPGQQLTATLRLSRLIGKGGMGSVWVADHLALGTQVAVKFMAPDYAQDAELAERFRREATAAAQIKNPHVAQVFEYGVTAERVPFIVMELLEGEDLKSRIRRLGPLPPEEVSRVVTQAAKALGRAHQLGIVHRDIKPDNLFLLDIEGELFVKVLDFGIAKQSAHGNLGVTSTGSMLGTPLFMSPEQLLSAKHVDLRADLWALGVVVYYALTARFPFHGETLGALSVAVHTGTFTAPSAVRPGLPPALDTWMQRALQRDPAGRFASAREMADTLEQAVSGRAGPDRARGAIPSAHDVAPAPAPPSAVATPAATPAPALGASGSQARTFPGVATTGRGTARSRRPALVVAALALGAGAAIAVGVWALTGSGAPEPEGPAAAVAPVSTENAAPATPDGPEHAAPAPPPTEVTPSAAVEPAPSGAVSAATTAAGARPGAGGKAANAGAGAAKPAATAPQKPAAAPKPKPDDIGF